MKYKFKRGDYVFVIWVFHLMKKLMHGFLHIVCDSMLIRLKVGDFFLYQSSFDRMSYWFVGKVTHISKEKVDDFKGYKFYNYIVVKNNGNLYAENQGTLSRFYYGSGFHELLSKVNSAKQVDLLAVLL